MKVPDQFSVSRDYPGFDRARLADSVRYGVWLDGVKQEDCVAYDIPRGRIVTLRCDERGPVVVRDGLFAGYRLDHIVQYGKVRVKRI